MTQAHDTMTADQRRRILSAIADCDRFIARESPRAADLRPAEVAETLAHYVAHRAKLLAVLNGEMLLADLLASA